MKCKHAKLALQARAMIRDCRSAEHLTGIQNFLIIVFRRIPHRDRLEQLLWKRFQEKANSFGRSAFSLEPLGVA